MMVWINKQWWEKRLSVQLTWLKVYLACFPYQWSLLNTASSSDFGYKKVNSLPWQRWGNWLNNHRLFESFRLGSATAPPSETVLLWHTWYSLHLASTMAYVSKPDSCRCWVQFPGSASSIRGPPGDSRVIFLLCFETTVRPETSKMFRRLFGQFSSRS